MGKFLICFSSKGGLGRKNLNFSTDFGHKRTFLAGKLKIIGRHRGVNVDLKVDFAKKNNEKLGFFSTDFGHQSVFWGNFFIFFSAKGGVGQKNLNFSTNFGHQRVFFGGKLKIIGRHRGVNVDLKLDFAKK